MATDVKLNNAADVSELDGLIKSIKNTMGSNLSLGTTAGLIGITAAGIIEYKSITNAQIDWIKGLSEDLQTALTAAARSGSINTFSLANIFQACNKFETAQEFRTELSATDSASGYQKLFAKANGFYRRDGSIEERILSGSGLTNGKVLYISTGGAIQTSSVDESTLNANNRTKVLTFDFGTDPVASIVWSQADANEQILEFNNALPANCKLIHAFIKCTETVGGSVSINLNAYITLAEDLIAAADCHVLGEIADGTMAKADSHAASIAARDVFVGLTPSANWNTVSGGAGTWKLYLTYVDYSA